MKRAILVIAIAILVLSNAAAQDGAEEEPLPPHESESAAGTDLGEEEPQIDPTPTRAFVFGPRVGYGYSFVSDAEFTQGIRDSYFPGYDETAIYHPYYTIFGFNAEYRILLGQTRDHFAIQTLGFLFGIEQSLAIPAGALMMGYRHHGGLEFGVGPVYNPSGMGVLLALGYTFSVGGVNIPLDLAYQIENHRMAGALSLSSGFNFTYDSSPSRTRTSRW